MYLPQIKSVIKIRRWIAVAVVVSFKLSFLYKPNREQCSPQLVFRPRHYRLWNVLILHKSHSTMKMCDFHADVYKSVSRPLQLIQ